ncbi:hypothetical protein GCM10022234_29680 [Aeromicrobium panaciterrae]|uniref:hypothetical protein n=1 Tax=Aeromicrobium panaciterrae TaxID=363861 RepID=UPI0031DC57F6
MSTPDDPTGQPDQPPVGPPPGYHPQPAAPYYYGPPAPQPANRGVWFAIGAGSMFALGLIGMFGMFFLFPFIFFAGLGDPDFDEGEFDEGDFESSYVYYVDQKSVVDAVEVPCNAMMTAGDKIKLFTEPDAAAASISAFAGTARGIADAIGSASPDNDSKQWQADWEKLAHELDTFATDLRKVGNDAWLDTFAEPGEAPIMLRMAGSSDANCEIPQTIFDLDPANSEYFMENGDY